jgi:hypothetical protein
VGSAVFTAKIGWLEDPCCQSLVGRGYVLALMVPTSNAIYNSYHQIVASLNLIASCISLVNYVWEPSTKQFYCECQSSSDLPSHICN